MNKKSNNLNLDGVKASEVKKEQLMRFLRWTLFGFLLLSGCLLYFRPLADISSNNVHEINQNESKLKVQNNTLYLDDYSICRFIPVEGTSRMQLTVGQSNTKIRQNGLQEDISMPYITDFREIHSFLIAEIPVTDVLWSYVMADTISTNLGFGINFYVAKVKADDWDEFIKRINKKTGRVFRLPTMDEWSYAAQGGIHSKHYKYAGSNDIDEVAIYGQPKPKDFFEDVCIFGKYKKPNELGLFDMSGGVWELTSTPWHETGDGFLEHFYREAKKNSDGSAKESEHSSVDNPDYYEGRVAMGGYISSPPEECALDYVPDGIHAYTGVRLILEH